MNALNFFIVVFLLARTYLSNNIINRSSFNIQFSSIVSFFYQLKLQCYLNLSNISVNLFPRIQRELQSHLQKVQSNSTESKNISCNIGIFGSIGCNRTLIRMVIKNQTLKKLGLCFYFFINSGQNTACSELIVNARVCWRLSVVY